MQHTKAKLVAARRRKPSARLTPKQLRRLADRMAAATDPAEVARLKEELERGFYGDPTHAWNPAG